MEANEGVPERHRPLASVAYVLAPIVVIALLGWRQVALRREIAHLDARIVAQGDSARYLTMERRALMTALARAGYGAGPFLVGTDIDGGRAVRYEAPRDGVYWIVRSNCPACEEAGPTINRVSAAIALPTLVLSLDDDPRLVRGLLKTAGITGAALAAPWGALVDRAPLVGTPAGLIVYRGQLRAFATGINELDRLVVVADSLMKRGASRTGAD